MFQVTGESTIDMKGLRPDLPSYLVRGTDENGDAWLIEVPKGFDNFFITLRGPMHPHTPIEAVRAAIVAYKGEYA